LGADAALSMTLATRASSIFAFMRAL
jgi:hypothetical protein